RCCRTIITKARPAHTELSAEEGATPGAPRVIEHARARLRTPHFACSAACGAALVGPGEDELPVARGGADAIARDELALQDLLRERILDLLLDGALERPRPVHGIEARLAEKIACRIIERQVHVAFLQPLAQVHELDVDDGADLLRTERMEHHDVID